MQETEAISVDLTIPPLELCTDNAAMIACNGYFLHQSKQWSKLDLNGIASLSLESAYDDK